MPVLKTPDTITKEDAEDKSKMYAWQKKYDQYLSGNQTLTDNLRAIYTVVWGQCSAGMKAKVKTSPKFEAMDRDCNCISLLKEIKKIMYQFEGQHDPYVAIVEGKESLATFKQQPHESLDEFLTHFQAVVASFEHYGGILGMDRTSTEVEELAAKDTDPGNMPSKLEEIPGWVEAKSSWKRKCQAKAREKEMAIMFLKKIDTARFGGLWIALQNQYAYGTPQYPTDLSSAYTLAST